MEQAAVAPSAEVAPAESAPAQESTPAEKPSLEAVTEDVNSEVKGEVSRETKEASAPEGVVEPPKDELKFKRKVNGQVIEATEDELWKHYGLEVTAREKMQQAALQRAEAEKIAQEAQTKQDALAEYFKSLQKKPELIFDLAEKMGHDPKLLARKLVLEQLEYERMSDADRRAYDAQKELERYRAERVAQEEMTKKEKAAEIHKQFVEALDTTISESLKLSGLQPRPRTVARMAEACQTLLDASDTGELPSPQKIAEKFLAMSRQDASEIMGEQDPDKLIELGLLSDTSIERIVKWHLEKTKKNLPSFGQAKASTQSTKEPSKKKIGVNKFFDSIGE